MLDLIWEVMPSAHYEEARRAASASLFPSTRLIADIEGDMKFGLSTATGGETRVYEISNELVPVLSMLHSDFHSVDIEVFFVFRWLPDQLGRKSSRRFSKAEAVLYLDMCFSEDLLKDMDVEGQRAVVASCFFKFTEDSLRKYRFDGLDISSFMLALKTEAASIGCLDSR
ncbi:hypothetical protein C1924_09325 [Stenotrophomonas sp. ESTM1D_MKCIP4_1]|uniref:hypothetical protein n=1 Tax=Stenotrophomonas sp. ESTM1D_MKCIP4_1 TaxID=2072414 RepID=UPI000D53DC36|nr:hypothetical protein [Stenotrophomonas sp. ESTM1D_MKCIP4_1]AWH53363.1 hypothetical protein C1924_09325 [Stenotrophomonas sp. ESTM1D_MKCIP4_1]